jgi:hypothetical protein
MQWLAEYFRLSLTVLSIETLLVSLRRGIFSTP